MGYCLEDILAWVLGPRQYHNIVEYSFLIGQKDILEWTLKQHNGTVGKDIGTPPLPAVSSIISKVMYRTSTFIPLDIRVWLDLQIVLLGDLKDHSHNHCALRYI
jgi:hypothetical protein